MTITVEGNNKLCFEKRDSEGSHFIYVNADKGDQEFIIKREDIAHYGITSQDKKDIMDAIQRSPNIRLV